MEGALSPARPAPAIVSILTRTSDPVRADPPTPRIFWPLDLLTSNQTSALTSETMGLLHNRRKAFAAFDGGVHRKDELNSGQPGRTPP